MNPIGSAVLTLLDKNEQTHKQTPKQSMCINITRLLGQFAPIFYFKSLRISKYLFAHFQNFAKFKNFKTQTFEILVIHKIHWGKARYQTKFGPDRFSRFGLYWIQTERQTSYVCIYIDVAQIWV